MDDESSDGDLEEDDIPEDQRAKRQEMGEWIRFCKEKINKIEKVWNRKLEESSTNDDDDSDEHSATKSQEDEDDITSHEDMISKILTEQVGNRFLSRSNIDHIR